MKFLPSKISPDEVFSAGLESRYSFRSGRVFRISALIFHFLNFYLAFLSKGRFAIMNRNMIVLNLFSIHRNFVCRRCECLELTFIPLHVMNVKLNKKGAHMLVEGAVVERSELAVFFHECFGRLTRNRNVLFSRNLTARGIKMSDF